MSLIIGNCGDWGGWISHTLFSSPSQVVLSHNISLASGIWVLWNPFAKQIKYQRVFNFSEINLNNMGVSSSVPDTVHPSVSSLTVHDTIGLPNVIGVGQQFSCTLVPQETFLKIRKD